MVGQDLVVLVDPSFDHEDLPIIHPYSLFSLLYGYCTKS